MKNTINKIQIIKNPIHLLAFGLGLGFMPFMPGTFGTLLGVLIYFLNNYYFITPEVVLLILTTILGIYICGKTAKDINHHDHPGIVFDEVVGYLVTMLFISFSVFNIILGFILFRIFDIVKPWPISYCDKKLNGGFGIMFDDILAGIFANIVLRMILLYV